MTQMLPLILKAYWAAARSIDEARYLTAVLNSATVLNRIIPMQPRGWRDPRDFDNLVWELPIPEYDRREALHRELADAATEAERVAAIVALREGTHFMRQRRAIRDALGAIGRRITLRSCMPSVAFSGMCST